MFNPPIQCMQRRAFVWLMEIKCFTNIEENGTLCIELIHVRCTIYIAEGKFLSKMIKEERFAVKYTL